MEALRSLQLQQFHQLFLSQGKRSDGRTFNSFRATEVKMNPIESADGSCCVRLGNTSIICGVRARIEEPKPSDPSKGTLDITCKLPPNSLHSFKWSRDAHADQETMMSSRLKEILWSSSCLDMSQLVIQDGKAVWSLDIEVIVLDFDGNILDTALTALIGCLASTSLPGVEKKDDSDGNPVNEYVFSEDKIPLKLDSFPFSSSFALFEGPDDMMLTDATSEEEILSSSSLSIIISHPSSKIVSICKDGGAVVSDETLLNRVSVAQERSGLLYNMIVNNDSN